MALSQLTQPIIVIGGGAFGTSTAYHLFTKGYTNVTVLDRFPLPAFEAAGNDINKLDIWRDRIGLFAGLYHPSGWIIGVTDRSTPFVEASMRSAKTLGVDPPKLVSTEEIREKWPVMNGGFAGWKSFWSPNAAWVNAREGIVRMAQEAINAGVKYASGSAEYAKKPLYDENQACVGVKCADGTSYFGSKIILAAGAAAGSLFGLENQVVAKGHAVGHIQLTPDEVEEYKDMPILDHLEGGTRYLHGPFHINYTKSFNGISLPRYRSDNPRNGIPAVVEARQRKWMEKCVPKLAHREWVETRICWFLPVFGKYIVEMMERWTPGLELSDYTTNPHPEKLEDMNEMPGWGPVKSSLWANV
ncbi:hypothetical protein BDV10DRAFT_200986 [Aspergillus recurvatus]